MNLSHPLPLILVAEDTLDDLFFFKRNLEQAQLENPAIHFRDGEEVVAFLQGWCDEDSPNERCTVGVLFLDIKMPRMSGFDVLQWTRAQPALLGLTIVMLSSSDDALDIARATQLGADGYLIKHPRPESIGTIVRNAAALSP